MPATKSSVSSPPSRPARDLALCAVVLALISAAAIAFIQAQGVALHYGDAAAHLNIARRLWDGRHPGYEQIGTVWLPLPHLLMMPFTRVDAWWRNGLAGAIPAGAMWVAGGLFLFAALRRLFGRRPALASLAIYATQPNLLYLQSTPMTESVFFACALALLYFSVRLKETQSPLDALLCGLAASAASLTRYEGWILIPAVGLYVLYASGPRRWSCAAAFGLLAAAGPLFWLAHNHFLYSDWLEFYRGPGSAKDIQKQMPYPGSHDWLMAARQFAFAVKAVAGLPLIAAGLSGIFLALRRRCFWPISFALLSPLFYVWSLHSGDTPIFVPDIYPFSHYNSRYALAPLPLLLIGCAAWVAARPRAAFLLPPLALCWFAFSPVIVKQEGTVNSLHRRDWTTQVASLLAAHYHPGTGIWMPFGDLTAALPEAGIPIRESIHQGDKLEFDRNAARPDLFLDTAWVIAQSGDRAATAMARARSLGLPYRCVKLIALPYSPVIEVWQRSGK